MNQLRVSRIFLFILMMAVVLLMCVFAEDSASPASGDAASSGVGGVSMGDETSTGEGVSATEGAGSTGESDTTTDATTSAEGATSTEESASATEGAASTGESDITGAKSGVVKPSEEIKDVAGKASPEGVALAAKGNETSPTDVSTIIDNETHPLESVNETENATLPGEGEIAATAAVAAGTAEVPLEEEEEEEELISEGDRVWREDKCASTYRWNPQTFSGFYYDLDENVGTENLIVHLEKSDGEYEKSIGKENLSYATDVAPIKFEFEDWGEYQVIGFMAEKYFAGYVGTEPAIVDKSISLINEGELRKVLVDSEEDHTVTTGSVLSLEEGYEIRIKEIDLEGNKVWLSIAKDGDEVDDQVVVPGDIGGSTYTYDVNIADKDVPLIMAHIDTVFSGAETSLVTIDGLFQISESHSSVEDGDEYGKMEVVSVSEDGIKMENTNSISLKRGKTVSVMGDVVFLVGDSDDLRFAPDVVRTGSYEIRGTVIDPSETTNFTWTPYNFAGFYYDIDDDVGSEELNVEISDFNIREDKLVYKTEPKEVKFEYSDWGKYDVIGFMAEKYFAGYNAETEFADEFSVINEGELRKILLDDEESHTMVGGTSLPLKEGYELEIKEVDLEGNKVWLSLTKDGDEVDDRVVEPGADVDSSTYTYEVSIGKEEVPLVAVYIGNVFRGKEADLVSVDGIFQVSDTPESVEEGETHGKMEVDSLSDTGISMTNDRSISLSRGKNIEIMGNLMLKVADNEERNFCPIVEIKGEETPLRLNIPEATVGGNVSIKVTAGGETISGASVLVNDTEIGLTNGEGIVEYVPTEVGSFAVVAKKSGYTDANDTIVVAAVREERKLAIRAPSEVLKGEDFLIKVTVGLNQTPFEGAEILLDGTTVGQSDDRGAITYSSNVTGRHTISAGMEGYENSTKTIDVLSPLKSLSLYLDEKAVVGKKTKITAIIKNNGTINDTREFELKVNGVAVETKNVTVSAGETSNVTFEYVPKEPGLNTVEIDGQKKTQTVEETKRNTLLLALFAVVIVAVGLGVYLYRTGELEGLRRRLYRR